MCAVRHGEGHEGVEHLPAGPHGARAVHVLPLVQHLVRGRGRGRGRVRGRGRGRVRGRVRGRGRGRI